MKNIIIAGGNGFLGQQFVNFLINKKIYNIHVIDLIKKSSNKKNLFQYKCNVLNEKSVSKLIKKIKKNFKTIDVLINCIAKDYSPNHKNNFSFENLNIKIIKKDIEIGILSSVIISKHVSKVMIKQKKGNILNIGSDLSIISPNQNIYDNFVKPISYSIAKHSVVGLTKYIATYLAKYNVRCNALCPGGIFNKHDKKFVKKLSKLIPLNRMAKINELNKAMFFLISDDSSYVTGHSLVVDGGRTIW
jgi:NAD(P)-dependent dehydrogenase (short-subunit alcohol dehydrogenase family)